MPPGIARAQFTVTGGTVFNNGSTSTDAGTNTNPNAGANSNSNQSFSYNGVTSPVNGGAIADVNASTGTISGNGLILDGTAGFSVTGTTVTMTNNGKIDTTSPGPIVLQALGLTSDGGAITYNGSGSVLNTPANGNGLVANATSVFSAVGGSVSIIAGGSIMGTDGIVASASLGTPGTVSVNVETSGNVTAFESTTYLGPQFAIDATTENGDSKVTVDSGTVTGGISSHATVNGNSLVTINGGTFLSAINSAITAHTLNGLNQVVINGGALTGAAGAPVVNAFVDPFGTGGVEVLMHGGKVDGTLTGSSIGINAVNTLTSTQGVVVTTDLGSSISMSPGTPSPPTIGILAQDQGVGGSGRIQGVTVTVGGTIAGGNIGVEAAITNGGATTNPNNVTVQVNNSIDAITTGVIATTAGTGNVYVGSTARV